MQKKWSCCCLLLLTGCRKLKAAAALKASAAAVAKVHTHTMQKLKGRRCWGSTRLQATIATSPYHRSLLLEKKMWNLIKNSARIKTARKMRGRGEWVSSHTHSHTHTLIGCSPFSGSNSTWTCLKDHTANSEKILAVTLSHLPPAEILRLPFRLVRSDRSVCLIASTHTHLIRSGNQTEGKNFWSPGVLLLERTGAESIWVGWTFDFFSRKTLGSVDV